MTISYKVKLFTQQNNEIKKELHTKKSVFPTSDSFHLIRSQLL